MTRVLCGENSTESDRKTAICECPHALSPRNFGALVISLPMVRILGGAQKRAAHSLHRLHPRKDRPRSPIAIADPASIDRLEQGAHAKGDMVRVQAEAIYPTVALGLGMHRRGSQMEKVNTPYHPAAAMGDAE